MTRPPSPAAITRILRSIFSRQRAEMSAWARAGQLSAPPDLSRWTPVMVDALLPLFVQLYQHGGQQAARRITAQVKRKYGSRLRPAKSFRSLGRRFGWYMAKDFPRDGGIFQFAWDIYRPESLEFIRQRVYDFCAATNATVVTDLYQAVVDLRKELATAVVTGSTTQQLNHAVAQIFDDPFRASRIAQTELQRAVNGGQWLATVASGVCDKKIWIASSDACFAAGSLVMKWGNGEAVCVGIETIRPGDSVIGGNGNVCRVLATRTKPYRGTVVCGNGFVATPDHRFLTSDGEWLPIGEYALKTTSRPTLDCFVGKSQDIPSAFLQVSCLPLVLPGDPWLAVPISPVAKNDEMHFIDNEIDNPPIIHRHLLAEDNTSLAKQGSHSNFDVSPFFGVSLRVEMDIAARFGTEIVASTLLGTDSRRVFIEPFPTVGTSACDFVFTSFVGRTEHEFGMGFGSASRRAEPLPFLCASEPSSGKFSAACFAFDNSVGWNVGVDLQGNALAFSTTEFSTAFSYPSRGHSASLAALSACNDSWASAAMLMKLGARNTTEPAPSCDVSEGSDVDLVAEFAFSRFGSIRHETGKSDALATTELSAAFGLFGETDEWFGAIGTRHDERRRHEEIISTFRIQEHDGFVYDIEVEGDHSFMLPCGLVAHNCDLCLTIAARGEIPLDEPFAVLGQGQFAKWKAKPQYATIMFPGAHPFCFCTHEGVISDDLDTLPDLIGRAGLAIREHMRPVSRFV